MGNKKKQRPVTVPGQYAERTPGPRGFRGRAGGAVSYVEPAQEWRGTSVQVCGLWPFAAAGGLPRTGAPLGTHVLSGQTVCADPVTWFTEEKLIRSPSAFVLGLNGLGKSSLIRKWMLYWLATGIRPLVLGDLKPDFVDLVRAVDGQVIELGRGDCALNVLDLGALDTAARRVTGRARRHLLEEAHARRLNLVTALVELLRTGGTNETERSVLSAALRLLADSHSPDNPPVLRDLFDVIETGPDLVRRPTLDRGRDASYRDGVDALQKTLLSMMEGPMGSVFARQTTTRVDLSAPALCIDISSIKTHDSAFEGAALLATWSEGYAAVEAANTLADAGLAPQRHYMAILDEFWKTVRGGPGIVDRVDALTRLNRQEACGQVIGTHSLADLKALPSESDREKARGFIERSGIVAIGGLPDQELDVLNKVVPISEAERKLCVSWNSPETLQRNDVPPGRGKFILKVGQRAGIPLEVKFTEVERLSGVHNTNKRWADVMDERPADRRHVPAPASAPVSAPAVSRDVAVTMVAFMGTALPTHSVHGPFDVDEFCAAQFARTELGAAMAATHIAVRTAPAVGPRVFAPTISEQTRGDSDRLLALRHGQYEQLAIAHKVAFGEPVPQPGGLIVAWSIDGFDPTGIVTVALLARTESGDEVGVSVDVVWDLGAADWHVVVNPTGSFTSGPVSDVTGYTFFTRSVAS
jgi:hypothetical protein